MKDEKYLKLLSVQYPSAALAAQQIIKLSSILNLPKGTEHFVSDIHGEADSFLHVLKNGSGSIRKKIDDEFSDELSEGEKRELATLVYYPEEKLEIAESENPISTLVPKRNIAIDPHDAAHRVEIFQRQTKKRASRRV